MLYRKIDNKIKQMHLKRYSTEEKGYKDVDDSHSIIIENGNLLIPTLVYDSKENIQMYLCIEKETLDKLFELHGTKDEVLDSNYKITINEQIDYLLERDYHFCERVIDIILKKFPILNLFMKRKE